MFSIEICKIFILTVSILPRPAESCRIEKHDLTEFLGKFLSERAPPLLSYCNRVKSIRGQQDLIKIRFDNQHTDAGTMIRHERDGCSREFLSSLVDPGRIRPHLEEGRSAGGHSKRKRIRGFGKTADFNPATFRGFRNVTENLPAEPIYRHKVACP